MEQIQVSLFQQLAEKGLIVLILGIIIWVLYKKLEKKELQNEERSRETFEFFKSVVKVVTLVEDKMEKHNDILDSVKDMHRILTKFEDRFTNAKE